MFMFVSKWCRSWTLEHVLVVLYHISVATSQREWLACGLHQVKTEVRRTDGGSVARPWCLLPTCSLHAHHRNPTALLDSRTNCWVICTVNSPTCETVNDTSMLQITPINRLKISCQTNKFTHKNAQPFQTERLEILFCFATNQMSSFVPKPFPYMFERT